MGLKDVVERIRGGLTDSYISTATGFSVAEVKKIRDILLIDKNLYATEVAKTARMREKKEVVVRAIKMEFTNREIMELTFFNNYIIEEIRETIDINNNLYFCTLQLKNKLRKKEKIKNEEDIIEITIKAIKKGMSNDDIMDLTDFSIEEIEELRATVLLFNVWILLKDRLVTFAGTTRERNVDVDTALHKIGNDTLLLFNNCSKEANISKNFIEFVINTIITTKSLAKTIEKVEKSYNFR